MNSKTTKRALLSSVVALFICFSMLLGTTFAWFTDTVTSAGNVIQSGTLDVDLVDANGKSMDGQVIDFVANDNRDQDEILWEPGCTYKTEPVKVVNKGNLALKYQIAINGINGDAKLLEAIEWSVTVGGAEIALDALNNTLLPGAESGEIVLTGHMKEEAGNEYQNLKVEGVSITVYATQLTYEKDSFDDQYDKMATIDNIDELNAALADDYDLIVLGANIELDESLVIPAGKILTIDLCGFKLYQAYAQTGAYAMIDNNGNLTIKDSVGTGKISYADIGTGGEYASNTISNKGVLTINGGTIENTTSDEVMNVGYPHAIDCYQGSTTTINGGTVKSINYDSIRMFCNSTTLATKVVINGGTIVNRVSFQNPNNNTHTPGYGILEINGGNFVTTDGVNANVRLLNFSRDFSNMKATVTGGTFDKGFKTQDYANCGVKTSDWLNYNGATAVANATELKDSLVGSGNVVLVADIADVDANTAITVASGVDVTLDLNGHKITATADKTGNQELFLVKGNMTVKNGSVELTAENNQAWNAMATIFDVTAGGVLKVDGVTANVAGTDMNFFAHLNNWGSATLEMTNCDITTTYVAVRAFNSGYDMNTVTIKNTDFHGRMFWVHNYTAEGKDDSTLTLDIYGNENTTDNAKPVRFGFSDSVYYDINGNLIP